MRRKLYLLHDFIPGSFHSRGYDSGIVVIGKFRITAVYDGFQPSVLRDTGLEIIWYQEPWYPVKILICVHMTEKPVLGLHVTAEFCIGVTAAREH